MKKTILLSAFGLISIAASQAATTASFADATTIPSITYTNPGSAIGAGSGDLAGIVYSDYTAMFAFDVDTILAEQGLVIGDLASRTFTIGFDSVAGTTLNAGDYTIGYGGSFAGATLFPDTGNNGTLGKANWETAQGAVTYLSTGISDISAAQSISLGGFSLAGAATGETVVFSTQYLAGGGVVQNVGNYTIEVQPVPEPSSSALIGLGGLAFIFRRRK
ncbi:MAG: PEP-CTERM sorting domain-containing protein [Akkermansiaceae bacterium]